jgi:hypothetical protein
MVLQLELNVKKSGYQKSWLEKFGVPIQNFYQQIMPK